MNNAKKWPKTLIAGIGAMALLTACSGQTESEPAPADTPATNAASPETDDRTTEQSPAPADRSTDDSPTGSPTANGPDASPTGGASPAANMETGFAAVALAEGEVSGSRAVSLDLDDDGTWDVKVIAGDTEHEFDINAAGTEIVERSEESVDGDDTRDLEQVQVPLTDAISTAMTENPGEFDDAELDTLREGTVVWEVGIDTPDNDDLDVHVDAASGDIVTG